MTTQNSQSSISIENVEKSIQNLTKSWQRRQKWHRFFSKEQVLAPNKAPWRTKLTKFLESTPLRTITISLLFVDLVLTILELSSSLLSCRPNGANKSESEEGVEFWYHWVGIGILSLLCLKSFCEVLGLGGLFFRRPGYVLDGIVLVVALVLEAFVGRKGGGLVVVVSLWRIVRVVESAFELSDEAIETQIEGVLTEFEALKEENRTLLSTIADKDWLIEKLEEELNQCKILAARNSL
ncbi:hypothetical protein LguiA_002378 [Lonicera macranthoides]